ncbi:FxSxx-COOH system tetratricopeptide repeat protein [Streptomyces sp. NBC_01803]|uniref:FxSxx-COOH system tetratricopeptide repeat protein n=1 Tax=Streptomyces sp. NBC_01803 TaxID=2975946 RepID=UPI002DDB0D4D|nr:FxSxx-COOH system tetratricopeptide repeat protein [Streptomyces sp. NBC_01803]WSA44293.1 FxSxx-COOH system tetratricopeptide repeat protein [Streptomyces sp. NBC_01803]
MAPGGSSARSPLPDTTHRRITISFAGFNRAWATWIADRLERHGWQVALQGWNPPVEVPLDVALSDLLLAEGRVLVVLSDWYFKLGPRTDEEWNAALRAVVAPNAHRFAAVSVNAHPVPTAAAAFGGAAELWDIGAREAERRLLGLLGPSPAEGETSSSRTLGGRSGPRFPHEPPQVWSGVPRRNTRFTGREATLQRVSDLLRTAEPGAAVVTLWGMSGVGKTQIAAEFVYRFATEYDVVWWVPADQRGTLRQRLAELAPALGLTTGPEYGERLRAVGNALRRGTPYSRWLIVLDGADDPGPIADLIPSGPGHVLITSQNRTWEDHNTLLHEVPLYGRDESVAFIRRRATRLGAEDADLLAEALGDLPLALDQTAGWLADSVMSVQDYVELLQRGSYVEVGLRVAADFPMSYFTAFALLLNRLREIVPEAVDLLRLCAYFAPGAIPVHLLQGIPAEDLPEPLVGLMNDPLRWNAAINKLVQYSVIRFDVPEVEADPDDSGTIHLHRMVHQTVRAGMGKDDEELFSRAVRRGLTSADPRLFSDTRRWPRFARIVPHLDPSGALRSRHPDMHRLIFNCLRYAYIAGEFIVGIQLAERTDQAWRDVYGDDHPLVWDLASLNATLVRATGDYALSERIDRAVIERLSALRGSQDLTVLRAEEGLGGDLRGLARYDEALAVSRRVLDAYLELVGERDLRTLTANHQVAASLRFLGRYREALEADRRILQARRELLRPRSNWSLSSENAYALDLRLLGRYAEALSLQEQSLETHRVVMGPDHPQTLSAEWNLSLSLLRLGERAAAHARLGGLRDRAERVLGEVAPLTLAIAASYAFTQRAHGDLDQARAVGELTAQRYEQRLGPHHPYAIGTRANQAQVLRAVGERQQAHLLIKGSLADMTSVLGPDHPWTLGIALNASAARNLDGDVEGAAELSRDTAHRAAAVLGPEHPLALAAKVALATDLRGLRQRERADEVEAAALSGLTASLGPQHPQTVSARSRVRPDWDFEPMAG